MLYDDYVLVILRSCLETLASSEVIHLPCFGGVSLYWALVI